jgi:hypothetical protein
MGLRKVVCEGSMENKKPVDKLGKEKQEKERGRIGRRK